MSEQNRFPRLQDALTGAGRLDLVLRSTLLLLALSMQMEATGTEWYFRASLTILAVIGLLLPSTLRSPTLWFLIAAVSGFKTFENWWSQDNHLFLVTYWNLAIFLALRVHKPEEALRTSARLLIGLVFLFAIIWRVFLSQDYVDGTFFHYTLLTDSRFLELGVVSSGVTEEQLHENLLARAELLDGTRSTDGVVLADTPALRSTANWMTANALLLEGGLALVFLWPGGGRVTRLRNPLLLLFAWTTYAIAPVVVFGWLLMTMGLAHCDANDRKSALLFVMTCPLLFFYSVAPLLSFFPR
jgi:hypothetical protein